MTKDVLIRIVYYYQNGSHYLRYEEMVEGFN